MKAFAIGTFTSSQKIRAFHYIMFHGKYGPDEPVGRSWDDINGDMSSRVPIIRNGTLRRQAKITWTFFS